jgi:hypothetical protein
MNKRAIAPIRFFGWLAVSAIWFFGCSSDQKTDAVKLAFELDSIRAVDQKYRAEMRPVQEKYGWDSPEMSALWEKQSKIDQSNLNMVLQIIDRVGTYPGNSLVGDTVSSAAFFVLQHAPDSIQAKYYDLIMTAAREGELDKDLGALYQDRYLMHRGEPQIFGTQVRSEFRTDSITGDKITRMFVWPIADTTRIDSLRMTVGLGALEEYLNRFGVSRWSNN